MIQFDQKKIDKFIRSPDVTDEKLQNFLRENAREKIAVKLIWLIGLLYGAFLVTGAMLVYAKRIEFRDLLDLILALGALAGFLGAAVNFYFKD